MRAFLKVFILPGQFFLMCFSSLGQTHERPLRLCYDSLKDAYGYVNDAGDTVIPCGKYAYCFTEKFDRYAIVVKANHRMVGINRNEKEIFQPYVFDNGPDYPSDGLFRIVKDDKIGYADTLGTVVVSPKFDCAYPFKHGRAEVGYGCRLVQAGEHSCWTGGKWTKIDKKGNTVK